MKKYLLISALLFFIGFYAYPQDTIITDGYNKFYYPDGSISSEGYMKKGQPDGYWKTYFENGTLKSEGNRKNFLLDSTWKFYNDSGQVTVEINFREGKKNGIRTTTQNKNIVQENFVNDIKQGWSYWYYGESVISKKVFFIDGREEGICSEYSIDGTVITLIEYKKGYIINTENINRKRDGLKHGLWKYFYPDGLVKEEGTYNYGKKNGYFKEYDKNGNLLNIHKYANDEEIYDAPELASYEVRTDYYRNGKPKIVASYKDGIPEGVRREYDQEGKIVKSYIFKSGIIIGEGIIDASGFRQGSWKEFFESGELYGEGNYIDGKKTGEWKFFYRYGKSEQIGKYNASGKPEGTWKWFYESGNIKREEQLKNGIANGFFQELSDSGKVIVKGNFIDGEEDGEWFYEVNDDKVIGTYVNGKKEGIWKNYFGDKMYFEGSYIEGLQDGLQVYYWDNGRIKEKGSYIAGKKEGNWVLFSYDGLKLLTLEYIDGIEISIDGSKIDDDPGK